MNQNDWYVITYRPNQSTRAERNLITQGVTCYIPRVATSEKDGSKLRELFTGYGFIRPGDASLSAVASTPGVGKLIHFNDSPALISAAWISAIKAQVERLNNIQKGLRKMLNQRVLVRVGVIQDLHSLVIDVDDKRGMVRVLYHMLGQPQKVWIDISLIRAHD